MALDCEYTKEIDTSSWKNDLHFVLISIYMKPEILWLLNTVWLLNKNN
jgi:hypothetical protein